MLRELSYNVVTKMLFYDPYTYLLDPKIDPYRI